MAVEIQVVVFWVMTLSGDVVGYQHFIGPCCLHLQGEVTGAGKGGLEIGKEYKRGRVHVGQQEARKDGNTSMGQEQGGVAGWGTTGTNRLARSAVLVGWHSLSGPTSSE
jgi:hypothetical protein